MTIALELAQFVREVKCVPATAREAAVRAVRDLIVAAVAGCVTPGGRAARTAAGAVWGHGPASLWFSDSRLTIAGAAFANAAIASMLDLDDGHRAASGHPGAAVIPAALATVQSLALDAEQFLTAIVIGYEIGVRVSAARDFRDLHTTDSGLWCGHGVAAAAGWLRELSPEAIAHALAIAGTTAPGQSATSYTRFMGNNVKEGIPWATANALAAVDLATRGFTGPIDLLDDEARYARATLTRGLGERWAIEQVYFKPYSCCRWAHAAIDGLLALKDRHGIVAGSITSIKVETFSRALTLNNDVAPMTLESAQYSIPFCLALAATHGHSALLPLDEARLGDRDVEELASRVRLAIDPDLDSMFPNAVPARITVIAGGERFVETVTAPKGEPSNPMSTREFRAKFDAVVGARLAPVEVADLDRALSGLENGDVRPLIATLAISIRAFDRPAETRTLAITEA